MSKRDRTRKHVFEVIAQAEDRGHPLKSVDEVLKAGDSPTHLRSQIGATIDDLEANGYIVRRHGKWRTAAGNNQPSKAPQRTSVSGNKAVDVLGGLGASSRAEDVTHAGMRQAADKVRADMSAMKLAPHVPHRDARTVHAAIAPDGETAYVHVGDVLLTLDAGTFMQLYRPQLEVTEPDPEPERKETADGE